jgi:hypothetical protein
MIEMSGKEFKVVLKLSMTSKKIKICRWIKQRSQFKMIEKFSNLDKKFIKKILNNKKIQLFWSQWQKVANTSSQSEWLSSRKQKTINAGRDVGGKEALYTVGANIS